MPKNNQRSVANDRERKRTQKLNQAYKKLQKIVPKEPSDKMSKIHTLKLTLTYIDFLSFVLEQGEKSSDCSTGASTSISYSNKLNRSNSRSPSCSSSFNGVYMSAGSSEEDANDQQIADISSNQNKNMRFAQRQHQQSGITVDYQQEQQTYSPAHVDTATITSNFRNNIPTTQAQIPSTYSDIDVYKTNFFNHNSRDVEFCNDDQQDNMKRYLREAFRLYRTNHPKRHHL